MSCCSKDRHSYLTSFLCFLQDTEERSLADSNLQEQNDTCTEDTEHRVGTEPPASENRVYLDLVPVRSFLHTSCGRKSPSMKNDTCAQNSTEEVQEPSPEIKEVRNLDMHGRIFYGNVLFSSHHFSSNQFQVIPPDPAQTDLKPVLNKTSSPNKPEQEPPRTPTPPQAPTLQPLKISQNQETPKKSSLGIPQAFSSSGVQVQRGLQPTAGFPQSPQPLRPKAHAVGEDGFPVSGAGVVARTRSATDPSRENSALLQ